MDNIRDIDLNARADELEVWAQELRQKIAKINQELPSAEEAAATRLRFQQSVDALRAIGRGQKAKSCPSCGVYV